MPLPQNSVLGAKDLPRAMLSDHIEEQLFKRLNEERHERAIHDGKSFDEVSAASSIYRNLRLWILCFLFLGYILVSFPKYEICGLCTSYKQRCVAPSAYFYSFFSSEFDCI
ncbi:hypothetical protein VPH35_128311 [Triticum aestivum]|uniref:Uncharacterized protein n=1 Tax=Triticum turgidum subsp. durum TaxID=4567 RepID=A0A9R1BYK1_TRITD|nr:unnamed protein product [Triticum turgidum subsp. durum]